MTTTDGGTPNRGAPGSAAPDPTVMAMLERIAAGRGPTAGGQAGAPPEAAPAPAGESREPRSRRRLLGEILLDEGLVTRDQLEVALRAQAAERRGTLLGQLLVEQGAITQERLTAVLARYNKTYRLGDLLLETHAITEAQLEIALRHQKLTGLRLGEVLLQLRYITEHQLRQALAKQFGIRFVDLDEMALDRGLAPLIDPDYARRHRVVPIGRARADQITVAMDDPANNAVLEALRRATGCQIEVVTALSAALSRAFAWIYGGSGGGGVRHAETVRKLAALRVASDRVRRDLDAGGRLLQGIERPAEPAARPAEPGRNAARGAGGETAPPGVAAGPDAAQRSPKA